MARRITLEWDAAAWEAGVAEELITTMLEALEVAGRVSPDRWRVDAED